MQSQILSQITDTSLNRRQHWLSFLPTPPSTVLADYSNALHPSIHHSKILNDAFRTLATCKEFQAKVSEHSMVRILNATINTLRKSGDWGYVQGMNIMLAPFSYVFESEVTSYWGFLWFIKTIVPTYVTPNLDGVHASIKVMSALSL